MQRWIHFLSPLRWRLATRRERSGRVNLSGGQEVHAPRRHGRLDPSGPANQPACILIQRCLYIHRYKDTQRLRQSDEHCRVIMAERTQGEPTSARRHGPQRTWAGLSILGGLVLEDWASLSLLEGLVRSEGQEARLHGVYLLCVLHGVYFVVCVLHDVYLCVYFMVCTCVCTRWSALPEPQIL